MRKILFVTDAIRLDIPSLDFACYICNLTHSRLTGVFLENASFDVRDREKIVQTANESDYPGTSIAQLKKKYLDESVEAFKHACEIRGVNFDLHMDKGLPVTDILHESRFADLIITDVNISFSHDQDSIPSRFITELLNSAECPVMTAPDNFDGTEEIIFSYDGSASATYAMKQFTYLFPELSSTKATVLCILGPGTTTTEDEDKMKDWLKAHYMQHEILIREDKNVRNCLLENLLGKRKTLIVMGAFGRNTVSNLLSPSHAIPLLKYTSHPLFIAHK